MWQGGGNLDNGGNAGLWCVNGNNALGTVNWNIGSYTFYYCSALTTLTLPPGMTGSIGTYAFNYCTALTSLVIQAPTMMTLTSTSAFTSTTCNIYVPDALVATYRAATNWSTLAARIKPISELP